MKVGDNLSTAAVLIFVFGVVLVWPSSVSSQATAARPTLTSTISGLAWISGDWQTAVGSRAQIEEHWTQPAGGSMIGMSRTIVGAKTVEFEYLRLEQRGDAIYYVASPKGRCPATEFKLIQLTEREAVFANPAHDFPKRIIYRKGSNDSLLANIDGGEGTKPQSFTYFRLGK